ncbi:ATPase, AAA family [Aphelenchoides fujianensis]|nr:ATPase, AAA family [Aphelenchoides fujianensis]
MPGRRLDSVRLLTRHALSSRLRKWAEAPLSVGFFDDDDERRLERAGADVGGVALIDPLSLLRLGLQPNEHAVLVFEQPESGKRAERTVFLRARRQLRSPGVRVSRSLVFNLFHDTQLRDAVVSEIRPAADSPPDCTELWLNRLRSAEDERDATSEEGLDAEIVDFFHTPRLVHTEDVIAVQHAGLRGKREVFFKLAVGSSPSIASANTKIFRGAPRTARFPRRRVDSTRSFVPAGLRRTVARCCEILEPLVCDEKADGKPPIVFILVGGLGSGRRLAVDSIADRLAVNRLRFDAHDLWNAEGRPTDSVVSSWVDRINNLQPCVCELSNLSVLAGNSSVDLDSGTRVLDVLAAAIGNLRGRIAFFITTTKAELPAVPRPIAKLVHFEEHCAEVGEDDRREFAAFVRRRFRTDVPSEWLAEATRGATLAELRQLLAEAAVNAAADGRRELQRLPVAERR